MEGEGKTIRVSFEVYQEQFGESNVEAVPEKAVREWIRSGKNDDLWAWIEEVLDHADCELKVTLHGREVDELRERMKREGE